jgi:F-type H+-transporting ATPase subunit epsilon
MAENKLKLKIITPEKILVNEEEVSAVYAKAVDGEFGVLPGHIPYMTALDIAVTRYIKGEYEEFVSVIGGILQVGAGEVVILTDQAELGKDIDVSRAKAAKERAEARLRSAKKEIDVNRAEISLARAIARIKAASGSH